ncbi:hypothetical protein NQ318_020334 [Aromia moschata]|uniref:Uncharacterized protein n=1 Tax=Aromia moschata TaxID=1265417 RepID=A0AAV8X2B2_9CUCU|nr:hypothetical protein NQ318_020334 [Aromia moschata]
MAFNNKNMQSSDFLNYYLTMNINNICRICLEKGPKLMPIFDPIKPPHFSILIMACAAVQVLEGDGLPPYICQKCISKLNIAFQFKTQCENSDAKLRQCFENYHHLPPTPDLAGFIDLKKDEQNTSTIFVENNDGGTNNHVQKQQQQQQAVEPQMLESNGIQSSLQIREPQLFQTIQIDPNPTAPLPNIDKNTLTELKIELSDLKTSDVDLKVEDIALVNITHLNIKTKKQPKHHQCDTCGKVFRTKPGLVHHIRIHTGERPYNHICAACSKAFATAQQLTKHTIAIHTSERPYGCTYCCKRFASSSNLNTHTKIHTGEKNYRCDQCGKAFSTKGQLYQHMLVHTEREGVPLRVL